jgi:DNA-binding transcriptional LysR family regulator
MIVMDLRRVDLNLLVILHALLDEAHVTRAAKRLKLSQPATSAALERARRLFDDRLLIRGQRGMVLTPKADRLRRRLDGVLAEMEDVLELRDEDLARIQQTVRLSMSDTMVSELAPALFRHLAAHAPGVDLVFVPWLGPGAAQDQLASGAVDLAVSQFPDLGPAYTRRRISCEEYRVVMRRGHPAGAGFSLEQWLAWPHVMASGRGEARSGLDRILASAGLERRIGVVVPTFHLVLELVQSTDLLATVPDHILGEVNAAGLEHYAPPLAIPGYELHIAWHHRLDDDPVTAHMAEFLAGHWGAGATAAP